MADHPVERLGGQTPLQYADTPYMDMLARKGRTGRLMTIPTGFAPGSEVANSAILGYDLNKVYEGRGPLEAASIGYEMQPGDMAMRCNIITLADGRIKNDHRARRHADKISRQPTGQRPHKVHHRHTIPPLAHHPRWQQTHRMRTTSRPSRRAVAPIDGEAGKGLRHRRG